MPRRQASADWRRLEREARRRFGIAEFRPGQRELIEAVFAGRDALGILPTGAGKSLCYQLPALFLAEPVVVVSPLISLMQDQQEKMVEADIDVEKIDSTLTDSEERDAAEDIREGEPELVYVTPERLENPEYVDLLAQTGVALFVVDEAHCVSQWGHDFRPAYLGLRDAIRRLGHPPVLALTATAAPEVARDILEQLALPDALVVNTGIERPNLVMEVARTVNEADKRARLRRVLAEERGVGIVYTATVREAEALAASLADEGEVVERYHGRMRPGERERVQQRFMAGEFHAIVATKAFGLGIDKPDIRFVVHYHFPDSLESYYQEAGRAGRDGEPARALLLYRVEDRRIQSYFLGGKYPRREESSRVWEALGHLAASGRGAVTAAVLAEAAGIGERRTRVIVAQLAAAGVVERQGRRLGRVRDFASREELDAFLTAYEQRHRTDRERLDAMMRYAETTECRMRFIARYFGEPTSRDCARCDNCRARAAGRFERRRPRRRPDAGPLASPAPFAAGEPVRHRSFGDGEVVRADTEGVVVVFRGIGEKKVDAGYLSRAS